MSYSLPGADRLRGHGRAAWLASQVGLALLAVGCQSYERQPVDLNTHRAAFLERVPQQSQVQQFASALAQQSRAAAAAFDLTDGINCDEAEVIALVFNPELRLARLRAGVSRATADNAGLWEDPTLGIDLTRILHGTPRPWIYAASIGFTLPISGRLQIEQKRAGMAYAAELARVAQQEWETRMALRRAWVHWSSLQGQLSVSREYFGQVKQVLALISKMEEAGEISRAEARLFRVEHASKQADVSRLQAQVQEAELGLKQQMGLSPVATIVCQPMGLGAGPQTPSEITFEQLESRSPALRVVMAEYEVAERTLQLEIRRQYPDLQIGPGYEREDGQNRALLELSMPIPLLNRNRQGIAEARAQRELARAKAETTLEQLMMSLQRAQIRLNAAREQREAFQTQVVPMVDALYDDARQMAQLGEMSTLVMLESLTRQQDAKARLIDALRDETLAGIEVEALLGPPVSQTSDASGLDAAADHAN